jgi:hypothetical protein
MQEMPKYHLKIASGYKASLDMYESKLLLCTELAHKLLNLETVWQKMEYIARQQSQENFRQICLDEIVGVTVMTKYIFFQTDS